jgi:hypothetical protein
MRGEIRQFALCVAAWLFALIEECRITSARAGWRRQTCSGEFSIDALSVVATVESGRGVAVVGEFITAVAGDRVRFVPFVSGAHFQEVGLLYRQSGLGENIRKLVAASLASKQRT